MVTLFSPSTTAVHVPQRHGAETGPALPTARLRGKAHANAQMAPSAPRFLISMLSPRAPSVTSQGTVVGADRT